MARRGVSHRTRVRVAVVAVVVAVFAGGAVLAANLPDSTGALGTLTATADCQSATLTPTWTFAYDPTLPGYRINAVVLDGLQSGCLDKNVLVVLADASGVSQATGTGTTPASGTTALIAISPGFDLSLTWVSQLTLTVYS